ncbi:MAG: hypothetical protein IJ681_09665 [Bacteroidales bacterium]|nr:hypothetical protein [Bacteroidales bacterium]
MNRAGCPIGKFFSNKHFVALVICCVFYIVCSVTYAQVEVIADGRLQTVLEKHVQYNRMAHTTKGFRIKVATFTGEGAKDKAFSLKNDLTEIFTDLRSYVVFDEPYFIVKLGDFPTRLDAYAILTQIKPQITTALIIQDYINTPVINKDELLTPEYFEEDLEE